ncbi:MAG: amidohydrolase [Anaerolineae bacterium]|nr:amidohydrolase [Anaerolineae bacterium]MDW8173060.1 amidohydrolase [Anaerolineae bacterium]
MDTIIYNATIITLDDSRPRAQALAIHQGRIAAVGSDDDVLALAQPHTRKLNANGAALIPGLIDSHLHWEWTTRALNGLDLFNVGKDEALARVAQAAQSLNEEDWLLGYGWSHGTWSDGSLPSAADLDAVAPRCKVYLVARSGHAAWVNSAALRAAGIADAPNPIGGKIVRDEQDQPTGILLETAMRLIRPFEDNPQQMAQLMRRTQESALSQGLTGFHDYDNPSCMMALEIMREEGALAMRVVKQINQPWLEAALSLGIRTNYGDDWIKFGGLKLFADGALGARTALMIQPYEGEPHNYGVVVVPKDIMQALVERATLNGLSATIHAIGDQAVRDVLDVYAHARRVEAQAGIAPAQRRHRIEHVQLIHADDAGRLAELQIIASMQPIHATSDIELADRYWGSRSRLAYNPRVQLDQGVVCAFGSDSPVEPFNPLAGIHAAVTRQRANGWPPGGWYPEARLSIEEALRGYTSGPAYAAYAEDRLGKLAVGFYADLVALDRDPTTIPADALLDISVLGTMTDGTWRYGGL